MPSEIHELSITNQSVLRCPLCGGLHLHQYRDAGDGDCVDICFWCEGCGNRTRLTIEHNKGQTLLSWSHIRSVRKVAS